MKRILSILSFLYSFASAFANGGAGTTAKANLTNVTEDNAGRRTSNL